jgi:hypothetical protein
VTARGQSGIDKKGVVGMRKRCQAEYGDGGRSTNGDFY